MARAKGIKAESDHQRNERVLSTWTRALGIFTIALAGAAAISDLLLFCSLQDTRSTATEQTKNTQAALATAKQAADAATQSVEAANRRLSQNEQVQRAYVEMNQVHYTHVVDATGGYWAIVPDWVNSGTTPTLHLAFVFACFSNPTQIDEPWERFEANKAPPTSQVIGPKSDALGGACRIADADFAAIKANTLHWYIGGQARYQDIFADGTWHITQFEYELGALVTGQDGSVINGSGLTVGRHNCADKDCE